MTESAFQPDRSSLRDHTSLEKKKEGEKEILFEKKTMILLAGLPASGKSTFAETHFPLDAIVSTDAIRGELSNNPGNQLMSEKAFIMAKRIIEERLKRGELVVFDAQNLSEDNRKQFYEIAARYDAPVEVIFFDVPPEETIRRDRARKAHVGADYIKTRRTAYRLALRALEVSPRVRTVHVLKGDSDVSVTLPPEYNETLRADRALREEARISAERLLRAENEPSPEQGETRHMIPIEAGSVVFFEGQTGRFTASNFLPDQVIDATDIARRLATTVDDAAVRDIMQFILKCRTRNNLTTAVACPDTFPFIDALQSVVRDHSAKIGVDIPTPHIRVQDETAESQVDAREVAESPKTPSFAITLHRSELEQYGIDIVRNAPDDAPLFIVGDVHGCYHATRVLADRIRDENRAARNGTQSPPPRQIIFIGDMADRGLYDADAVMYITALVRSGRAMLIRGNHDENLMRGLKGEAVKSGDTRQTIAAIQKRLKPESIQKIIEMIEAAPYYTEWQRLVAVHAALPRIPRRGERLEEKDQKVMTHGARTGRFVGRAEVYKLQNTTAKDPGIVAIAGHTHEVEPIVDVVSDTVNVDVSAQVMGRLYGMYYPERQFAYAEEPEVMALYRVLTGDRLPEGEMLLAFIDYAEKQGFIHTKEGQGEYDGLMLASYSEVTELGNLWEQYPVLRHFRGLIIDRTGAIVARPFAKSHKAGEEIPLTALEIIPEKVFEKANGSLGIAYFWDGKWRFATKFSFQNEAYTKPATAMFAQMQTGSLDSSRTYLFEIILPNDSHIVDYGGKQDLILLNAIDTKTGRMDPWESVAQTAKALGATTARDMTEQFSGMTIAEIYAHAQRPGALTNLEGMMALHRTPDGQEVLVKVKVREYTEKKFVRDYLDWKSILDAFDRQTLTIAPEEQERLLRYNTDNVFARAALTARMQWVQEQYQMIVADVRATLRAPMDVAERQVADAMAAGADRRTAIQTAMGNVVAYFKERAGEGVKEHMNALMGFVRDTLSLKAAPEERLGEYALARIAERIEIETKKRGQNSFWVVPE